MRATSHDEIVIIACSFRLTGRLQRREPELSRVFLNNVLRLLSADSGLAPRARRDVQDRRGCRPLQPKGPRPRGDDGSAALLALGQLLLDQPERDVEETTDRVTEDLLRMFGVPAAAARRLCRQPLPDLPALQAS